MKLAKLLCSNPSCKTRYEVAVDDDTRNARCPSCTQFNTITDSIDRINGRCTECGNPLDHKHLWQGDRVIACLPK